MRRKLPNRLRPRFDAMEDRRLPSVAIQVDYTRDASGFFADVPRRQALEHAADTLAGLLGDALAPIAPAGGNHWSATFLDPGTGAPIKVADPTVPADILIVYAGGHALGEGGELGWGGPGGYETSGSANWRDLVSNRGQAGASGTSPTDFAPWGGSVAFATDFDRWYFGDDASAIRPDQIDFTSVALHELGHVLGIGTAASWTRLAGPSGFVGPRAMAANGGPVPLDPDGEHWADGTLGDGRPAAMDPTPEPGRRVPFTRLDIAGLADLGWQVPDALGPTTFALASPQFDASEAAGVAVVTIRRFGDPSVPASVAYATADGTAIAGLDYTAGAGVLDFLPGETTRTVAIPLRPDALAEGTETFRVDLARPTGTAPGLGLASATVHILDAPGRLRFSGTKARVGEGAGVLSLTIERIGGLGGKLPFAIDVDGGTATLGGDYALPASFEPFADGQRTAIVAIPILDDATAEPDETFRLVLRGLGGTEVVAPSSLAVTIADDDPPLGFAVASLTVDEDAGEVVLTVRRTGATDQAIVVGYATTDDTARAGLDYEAASGSLALAAGQTEASFRIPIFGNPEATGDLRFRVALRPPAGSDTPLAATVVIRDLTPAVSVAVPTVPADPVPPAPVVVVGPIRPDFGSVSISRIRDGRIALVVSGPAALRSGYRLTSAGRDGKFATTDDRRVPTRRIGFDANAGTVTLVTRSRAAISRKHPLRLTLASLPGSATVIGPGSAPFVVPV